MIGTEAASVPFSKYFYTKIIKDDLFLLLYICFDKDTLLFCDFQL